MSSRSCVTALFLLALAGTAPGGDTPAPGAIFADGFETPRIAPEGFRDCPECPLMISVPGGEFTMGNLASASQSDERPLRVVTIAPLAVSVFEITWREWELCVEASRCDPEPVEEAGGDEGFGRERRPVLNVSWDDAQDFVTWLNRRTSRPYRLLSEAEWEYVARAGTDTVYAWGDDGPVACAPAVTNAASFAASPCNGPDRVGSYGPNAFGLFDVHGNVFEWVEDCFNDSYVGAPADGAAWLDGDCATRMVRGGSHASPSSSLRVSNRAGLPRGARDERVGFRVVRHD
ncbi:MAG: SUMF1/EgtB/PvdO family nonheme iron enzyme [Pseudomonadota bacterium]